MLDKLFELISDQAIRAAGVTNNVLQPPGPKHLFYLKDNAGNWLPKKCDPEPRCHQVGNVAEAAKWAKENDEAKLWYNRAGVVVLINDFERRDKVFCTLKYSQQLEYLSLLTKEGGRAFDQRSLIALLRTLFKGCLASNGNLVDNLRQVKFQQNSAGESDVGHGKASYGKRLEQQITGIGIIPEYITFTVPIWESGFHHLEDIEFGLEPDPATQKFSLLPIGGAIELALTAAENAMGDWLRTEINDEEGLTVCFGKP